MRQRTWSEPLPRDTGEPTPEPTRGRDDHRNSGNRRSLAGGVLALLAAAVIVAILAAAL